jgi:CHAD domain-containing protein
MGKSMRKAANRSAAALGFSRAMNRRIATVTSLLSAAARKPDPDTLHDLRTGIRRIRAGLAMTALTPAESARLDRRLKATLRALGRARDLDVAIDRAKELGLKTARLRALRRRAGVKLDRVLKKRCRRRLERSLGRAAPRITALNAARAKRAAHGLLSKLENYRKRLPRAKPEYHELRKSMRKARYTLELAGKSANRLVQLQDALGELHDFEILNGFIGPKGVIEQRERRCMKRASALVPGTARVAIKGLQGIRS